MWGTEGHPEHEGITGVTFAFAWHRAQLRVLIAGWLDEVGDPARCNETC
jgi:hypothetical protein